MNREEQQLIDDLFSRLRGYASGGQKDPDADALIRDHVARSPDAPYYLAQTVIIQQQALERAEAKLRELEAAASQPSVARATSFLGGASVPAAGSRFGTAPQPQPQRTPDPAAAGSPWSSPPTMAGGGTGGFLSSALSTAAGVAGGVFLADGIRSLFGGSGASAWGGSSTGINDQARIDSLQDQLQDARDDDAKDKKDLAADDAELDRMQDAQDDQDDQYAQDDSDDSWADDDTMDV